MFKEKSGKKGAVIGFTSAFLIMLGAVSVLPFAGIKAEAYTSTDGMWEVLQNDIVAYNGSDSEVTIPSEVTYISDKDIDGNGELDDKVTVNIIDVRRGVFTGNTTLKKIVVSEGIETLGTGGSGERIFKGCTNLSDITLPSTITKIDTNLLSDCAVKNITVNSNITSGNFGSDSGIESVTFSENVTAVPDSFFVSSKTLKSITFSDTVKTIGEYAFASCEVLAEVNVPVTVETIGYRAFGDNQKLAKVTVGAENIGANAFYWNGNGGALKSLTILDGVKTIGESAFAYQPLSSTLTLPDTVEKLDKMAFFETGISKLVCGTGLKVIGESAFGMCESLTKIDLNEGLEEIGERAFSYSAPFKGDPISGTLTIPSTCKIIGPGAFYMCENISKVKLPDGLEEIDGYAFKQCINLTSIDIPDSVTFLGAQAFDSCLSLKKVKLPNNIEIIHDSCFAGTQLASIEIPASVKEIGNYAFSGGNSNFPYDTSGTNVLQTVTLNEGLEKIGEFAFADLPLKSIKFPDSLTEICAGAFDCSGLVEIESWGSVETMGEGVFASCGKLTTVPPIPAAIGTIPLNTFSDCRTLKEVVIEDGMETIGRNAFFECALEKVKIPDSVTMIEEQAFGNCGLLKEVDLGSGVEFLGKQCFINTSLTQMTVPDSLEDFGYNCLGCFYIREGNGVYNKDPESLVKHIYIPNDYNFTIYGSTDEAREYAEDHGFLYNPENPPATTEPVTTTTVTETTTVITETTTTVPATTTTLSETTTIPDTTTVSETTTIPDTTTVSETTTVPNTTTTASETTTVPNTTTTASETTTVPDTTTTVSETTTVPDTTTTEIETTLPIVTGDPSGTTEAKPEVIVEKAEPGEAVLLYFNNKTEQKYPVSYVKVTPEDPDVVLVKNAVKKMPDGTEELWTNASVNDGILSDPEFPDADEDYTVMAVYYPSVFTASLPGGSAEFKFELPVPVGYEMKSAKVYNGSEFITVSDYDEDAKTIIIKKTMSVMTSSWAGNIMEFTNCPIIVEYKRITGDISGNGKIDIYDAIDIAKFVLKSKAYTEAEKKVADFNGDNKVNIYDAIAIARYLLKRPK